MEEVWSQVLPQGVGVQSGAPPKPPVDFEDGFVLPPHCVKPLQERHRHPLPAVVEFAHAQLAQMPPHSPSGLANINPLRKHAL